MRRFRDRLRHSGKLQNDIRSGNASACKPRRPELKIVVTGGLGFIGSAIIRELIRNTDFQVICLDAMTYSASRRAVEECDKSRRYNFVKANIQHPEVLTEIFEKWQPDAVLHLAAETHVDRSIGGPDTFVKTNLVGTFNLLQTARKHWKGRTGCFRFHHVSTDEVFGSLEHDVPRFTEVSPYRPNSPYSATKAGSDHLVQAWGHTYGLPVVISACSNNYGPWQHPEKFIPSLITAAIDGRKMAIYGDGKNIRDWLYVEDHARAIAMLLAEGKVGEAYVIGAELELANIQVARTVCRHFDEIRPEHSPHDRLIEFVNDRPGHDFRYGIDPAKMYSEIGWSPETEFEAGLSKTIEWYINHENWWRKKKSEVRRQKATMS